MFFQNGFFNKNKNDKGGFFKPSTKMTDREINTKQRENWDNSNNNELSNCLDLDTEEEDDSFSTKGFSYYKSNDSKGKKSEDCFQKRKIVYNSPTREKMPIKLFSPAIQKTPTSTVFSPQMCNDTKSSNRGAGLDFMNKSPSTLPMRFGNNKSNTDDILLPNNEFRQRCNEVSFIDDDTYDENDTNESIMPNDSINETVKDKSVLNTNSHNLNQNVDTTENDDEKLTFLHLQLKSEAVRLEKWKNTVDKNLAEKTLKLEEAEKVIDNLRKSNLNLQMDQENYSFRLKNEIDLRKDIEKKILSTRELCDAIKQQILFYECINNKVKETQNGQKGVQFIMQNLFINLSKEFTNFQERTKNFIALNNNKICKLKNSLHAITQESKFKDEKICELESSFSKLINESKDKMDVLSAEKNNLIKQIDKLSDDLAKMEVNLKTEENNKTILEEKVVDMQISLTDFENKFTETCNKLKLDADTIQHLKTDYESVFETKTNLELAVIKQKELFEQCIEEKKCLEATLLQNQKALEESNNYSQQITFTMQNALQQCKEKIAIMCNSAENNSQLLQKNYLDYENILSLTQRKLENKEEDNTNCINKMKRYEEEIKTMNSQIWNLERLCRSHLTTIEDTKHELKKLDAQLLTKDRLTRELEESILQKNTELSEALNSLGNITQEKHSATKQILDLEERIRNSDKINSNFREENVTIKKQIDNLTKQLQELDKLKNVYIARANDADINLKNMKVENEQLRKQILSLDDSSENILQNVMEKEKEILQLKTQSDNAQIELRQITTANKNLETLITNLEIKNKDIAKRSEEVRKELVYAMEQQQNEHDIVIHQKTNEIESLHKKLENQQDNLLKENKKLEKKVSESMAQVEKMKEQIKDILQDKKELQKKLTSKEQTFKKKEQKLTQQESKVQEVEKELNELKQSLQTKIEECGKLLDTNTNLNKEVARLINIEKEYNDYRSKIISNSPPASSQYPFECEASLTLTPKSPALSIKLGQMCMDKTPQKTPRSILKQPGSASKRRRVFFTNDDDEQAMEISQSKTLENTQQSVANIDLNDILTSPVKDTCLQQSPIFPKTPMRKVSMLTKNPNVRKTPGKATPQSFTKIAKEKSDVSWFDNDPVFGLNVED